MKLRRAVCAVIGHNMKFLTITNPRQWVCVTCGKRKVEAL